MAFTKTRYHVQSQGCPEVAVMPFWMKLILTLIAIPAIGAALYFVLVMCVLLFGDWKWGPS